MTKEERCRLALENSESGMNCAQTVLCSFTDLLGLTKEQCLGLGTNFGGGMRCGGMCGAVSGSLMVLGTLYPQIPGAPESKTRASQLTVAFEKRFQAQFDHLNCRELLASDVGAGTAMAQALDVHAHCRVLEVSAVELLCDFLSELE
jgi:C_GCAxxG_C_C family probable redox protein